MQEKYVKNFLLKGKLKGQKLKKRLEDYTINIGRNNIPTFGGIG